MGPIIRTHALGICAATLAFGAVPAAGQTGERQFLYCVASADIPGGNAYFTKVYPGSFAESPDDEEAFFKHISSKVDADVMRNATYCYTLDTFEEAGLDREEGVEVIRSRGWSPVDIAWRP